MGSPFRREQERRTLYPGFARRRAHNEPILDLLMQPTANAHIAVAATDLVSPRLFVPFSFSLMASSMSSARLALRHRHAPQATPAVLIRTPTESSAPDAHVRLRST